MTRRHHRVPAAAVRALAADRDALARAVLSAAFPEADAAERAIRAGVRVRAEVGWGGGVRGLLIWRPSHPGHEFCRLRADGVLASVVRAKVLALFGEVPA